MFQTKLTFFSNPHACFSVLPQANLGASTSISAWTARHPCAFDVQISSRLVLSFPADSASFDCVQTVPEWWYLIVFLTMFAFGIISIEAWPTWEIICFYELLVLTTDTTFQPVSCLGVYSCSPHLWVLCLLSSYRAHSLKQPSYMLFLLGWSRPLRIRRLVSSMDFFC